MSTLPASLKQPLANRTDRDAVAVVTGRLTQPATRQWTAGRVATLLLHYYVKDVPAAVVERVAEDWLREIGEAPAWAIADACAWWISRENPDRKRKPMPGDISDRIHKIMEVPRVAQMRVAAFDRQHEGRR